MAVNNKCSWFTRFASATAHYSGHPATFVVAIVLLVLWAASGPVFGFNDTWQLVVNTSTTIITFLMVFLIQNTQNRDSEALHIKMDELIRVTEKANNALMDIEELGAKELDGIRDDFGRIAEEARGEMRKKK